MLVPNLNQLLFNWSAGSSLQGLSPMASLLRKDAFHG
jgi:hypothetical protein